MGQMLDDMEGGHERQRAVRAIVQIVDGVRDHDVEAARMRRFGHGRVAVDADAVPALLLEERQPFSAPASDVKRAARLRALRRDQSDQRQVER